MQPARIVVAMAVFTIVLFSAGCAGIGKPLDPPRVSLANIRVEKFTGFEALFHIQLRVMNANEVNLEVKGIEAELEINGQSFASGVSNTPARIPAFGTELVEVAVYSSVIRMFKSVYGLRESEELKYRLKGKLRVAAHNSMGVTLPFESKGAVMLNATDNLTTE